MKYPFSHCLEPRWVTNPYTGDSLIASCGHCVSCLMNKARRNSTLCDLESDYSRYTAFVTTTYDDDSVPRALLFSYNNGTHSLYFPRSRFCLDAPDDIRVDFEMDDSLLSEYFSRLNMRSDFERFEVPVLCKRDVQLFIKRLKQCLPKLVFDECYVKKANIQKYQYVGKRGKPLKKPRLTFEYKQFKKSVFPKVCEECSLRFYCCGEYGPQHFRPHYHFLFWFENVEIWYVLDKAIRESWSYGRIDCQRVTDSASSYVASYVGSNSVIPELLKVSPCRPFSCHSFHLGQRFYQSKVDEVYEKSASDIVFACRVSHGRYEKFRLWRSYYSRYFPRTYRFSESSYDELYKAYTIFPRLRSFGDTPMSCAYNVSRVIFFGDGFDFISSMSDFSALDFLCRYMGFKFSYPSPSVRLLSSDSQDLELSRLQNRLYRMFFISRWFVDVLCSGNLSKATFVLNRIISFYNDLDMVNLNQSLSLREEFLSDKSFASLFYSDLEYQSFNDILSLSHPIYKNFRSLEFKRFYDSIKHKRQNDANKLFM